MDEADPATSTGSKSKAAPGADGRAISVLMLTPSWQTDTYGMATLTRSMVNDLRLTDPEGHKIHITCAILEDRKISEADISDAKRQNVELKAAKPPRHNWKEANIKWLDDESIIFYRHLVSERQYDFIVGHMPHVADGTFNLQDICFERGYSPKVILVVHALPKTQRGDVDRERLISWLKDVDIVLSSGHGVEAEITPYFSDIPIDRRQKLVHNVYIPACALELLTVKRVPKKLQGKQVITLMTCERKDLSINGLDYELAAAATVQAADSIFSLEGMDPRKQIRMEFMIIASNNTERDLWEKHFLEIKEAQPVKFKGIATEFRVVANLEELMSVLNQTTLFLFPLKSNSPLFGIEALNAAAACTPILV